MQKIEISQKQELESKMWDVVVALVNATERYNSDNVNAYVGTLGILDRQYNQLTGDCWINWEKMNYIVENMNKQIEDINNNAKS